MPYYPVNTLKFDREILGDLLELNSKTTGNKCEPARSAISIHFNILILSSFRPRAWCDGLVVEFLEKIIEFALLLQTAHACGTRGFVFESEMHALMPTVLLRMTGLEGFGCRQNADGM